MNILFLSLGFYESISISDIYADLLKEFIRHGHRVSIVSPAERRRKIPTGIIRREHYEILYVRTGNIRETNMLEKGISTVLLETAYQAAVRKYFADKEFGLILYVTPPVTFLKAVQYIRRRDNAKTYLMLKDIFPQNAVDLGILAKTGPKGFLYRKFRKKEKRLYQISDHIGCMSPKNIEYVQKYNPSIARAKVELCPNCIAPSDERISSKEREQIRKTYGIPPDSFVFIYGGNLGKAQGIPLLIECIKRMEQAGELQRIYWMIVGGGTEYQRIAHAAHQARSQNVRLLSALPKEEYEKLVRACDCGMIFLDARFTVPNFPSRLLSYMDARLPVLAVTNQSSDVGDVICQGHFGWKIQSGRARDVVQKMGEISKMDGLRQYGENAYQYLLRNYTPKAAFDAIMRHMA